MLRLAVTTRAETFERIREPLAERGIEVVGVQASERTVELAGELAGSESAAANADTPFPDVDVGFVYPSRLMEGAVLDAKLEVSWVNGRDAVLVSRNKAEVIARLAAAGVPVPDTTLVSNPVEDGAVADAAAGFSFPIVIKPNSTTRGVGVAKAGDLDSLLGVVDYLELVHDYRATGDRSYLLQEFLPDARDYRAMVVNGECVGGVERRLPTEALAEGRWKHNVHRGATAEGVDLPDRHRRLAERTAEVLDVDYLGVDLLETDDRLLVNETNARPTVDDAAKYDPGFYDRLASLIRRVVEDG